MQGRLGETKRPWLAPSASESNPITRISSRAFYTMFKELSCHALWAPRFRSCRTLWHHVDFGKRWHKSADSVLSLAKPANHRICV